MAELMFGDKIKRIREERGYTQKYVADMLHINYSTYSRYENNSRIPDVDVIDDIASFFGVPFESLYDLKRPRYQRNDLNQFLDNTEILFDGELHKLDDEDRKMMRQAIEFVFWQSKHKNKRK